MAGSVADWVANKLAEGGQLSVLDRNPQGFLEVESQRGGAFYVAVLGSKSMVMRSDVTPLFQGDVEPDLVINVPSSTPWSGAAIDYIHSRGSAFGTFGDISRAARLEDAGSYRNKNIEFFKNAMKQHTNVSRVDYLYETVFNVSRDRGQTLAVAVIEAYNLSAEDIRNALTRFGRFDIAVKGSSYGSVTYEAQEAAKSMGAEALTFRELMGRLAR